MQVEKNKGIAKIFDTPNEQFQKVENIKNDSYHKWGNTKFELPIFNQINKYYLILLSIQQTCKYRGINFFDFLKSGELNVSEYEKKVSRKKII